MKKMIRVMGILAGFFLHAALAAGPATNYQNADSSLFVPPVQPAFGDTVSGLSKTKYRLFKTGKKHAFNQDLLPTQGLGPIFNSQHCTFCHNSPEIGGGSSAVVQRFGQTGGSGAFDPLINQGGSLLQVGSTSGNPNCQEHIPAQANVHALRVSPPVFGSGLVEAIPDLAILEYENNPPPGISGRAHIVQPLEGGPPRLGRFGWKAQVATVLSFSADAAANEAGLTNDLVPLENMPNSYPGDPNLLAVCNDGVADPDDHADAQGYRFIDRLTQYQAYLAAPPQTPKSGMAGEALFHQIGCADCHRREYTTSPSAPSPLGGEIIRPYSDFLLHDMGGFGDGISQGQALPTEMKTPPLWGLKVRQVLLHDGSANAFDLRTRVEQAVHAHDALGSEARPSAINYFALQDSDQQKVITFLASLGRREFDANDDRLVNAIDFAQFRACYQGSQHYDANHACAISDVDQDQSVNVNDLFALATVYAGPIKDCNCNGTLDLLEILNGALDQNNDLSPDACHKSLNLAAQTYTTQPGTLGGFASVTGVPAGSQVTFYYGFRGEGNGGPYGDAICLNVSNPRILGSAIANSSGVAVMNINIAFPATAQEITLQVGYPGNGGVGAVKSQIVSLEIEPF